MKTKSEIWTNSSGKRFVLVPLDDFARLTELIEDAGLSRILREAKTTDRGEAAIPFEEVKRQLAVARRRESKQTNGDFNAIENSKKRHAKSPRTPLRVVKRKPGRASTQKNA